jgi:hypothetical protein
LDRRELAENLLKLNANAHWQFYVRALQAKYDGLLEAFLNSDHPDEALRGECRAYQKMLKQIHFNNGTPT